MPPPPPPHKHSSGRPGRIIGGPATHRVQSAGGGGAGSSPVRSGRFGERKLPAAPSVRKKAMPSQAKTTTAGFCVGRLPFEVAQQTSPNERTYKRSNKNEQAELGESARNKEK